MRFALEVVTLGHYADPRHVVEVALAAELSGWDGLFVWDHGPQPGGMAAGEAFTILAAVAARTTRLRIGTSVTALPRRHPHLVAHAVAALDLLSNGRLVFAAGAGGQPEEFAAFGQSGNPSTRATMLDEGLEVLDRLLRGEEIHYRGDHYVAEGVTLAPLPLQSPRPPIWIGGISPPALRRAARWDGWTVPCIGPDGSVTYPPERLARSLDEIRTYRSAHGEFDVAVNGQTEQGDRSAPDAYARAGATWWLESIHGYRDSPQALLHRVAAGPPA